MSTSQAKAYARSISRAVAIHFVLDSFAKIAASRKLKEFSSFDTLDSVLRASILEEPLLAQLNLDFMTAEKVKIRIVAHIDWIAKRFSSEGLPGNEEDYVSLDDDEDFETALSRKLKIFRGKVIELIELHKCDGADWSVVLRSDQAMGNKSAATRNQFHLSSVSSNYQNRVDEFDEEIKRGSIKGSYSTSRISGLGIMLTAVPLRKK